MLRDTSADIILELTQRDLVMFAPKTVYGLKIDYPELDKDPSFSGLGAYDMKFVWAWSCESSPFIDIEDRDLKLKCCVHYAYPEDRRKAKMSEYSHRISEPIQRGVARMERYSKDARVTEYMLLKQARDNIASIMAQDVTGADSEGKKAYLDQVKVAQVVLAEQRSRIEGLDLGISDESDTLYSEAVDILALYHQQN